MHVGFNLVFMVPGQTGGMEIAARELLPVLRDIAPGVRFTAFVNREAAGEELGVDRVVVPVTATRRVKWVRGEQQLLPPLARRAGCDLVHSLASTAPAWGPFARVTTIHDLNFLVVPEDRTARQIAEQRQARERAASLAQSRGRPTLESLFERLKEGEKTQLNLILKGDVSGSVEAVEDALLKIDVGEEVSLRIIHRGVGAITENDVTLASASDAVILGFNVRPEGKARELAERERVDVRYYSVIYAAIEDVEAALKGMLKPEFEEVQLGTAEVREVFRSSKFGNIAGCLVRSGTIRRNSSARLVRDGVVVAENLRVESLRRFKDDATEVREGYECGIGLGSFNDIKNDDVIETFENREKPRG
jgi:translation initiation factor IF-2